MQSYPQKYSHQFKLQGQTYDQSMQDLRKTVFELREENNYLKNSNDEYYRVIQEQNREIEKLKNELAQTRFELQLQKSQSLRDIATARNYQTIQPYRRKRIFENKTTLHMSSLSPKNSELEVPLDEEPQIQQSDPQEVVVQEIQVYDYSPDERIDKIIEKYSKASVEVTEIQLVQKEEPVKQALEIEEKRELLFEQFLIISSSKEQIKTADQADELEFYVNPEILFNHPEKPEGLEHQLGLLPQYLYPYGLKVKQEQKTDSKSCLNSLLMGGQSYDRLAGAYVITMKSDNYFSSKDSYKFDNFKQCKLSEISDVHELIKASNPDQLLYCICIDVPDFYDRDEEELPSARTKRLQKRFFYSLQKTYCFITKAPLIDFFIDTIKVLINSFKYKRAEIYSMLNESEEVLSNIDNRFYLSFKPDMYQFLSVLQAANNLSSFSEISFLQNNLKIPQQVLTYSNEISCLPRLYEIEWAASYSFIHITLPHFLVLIICLLLEQNICIVSVNRTLLSALLMILPHSIAPFQFIHPTIFSLTGPLMPILESPVPFLCGILKDKECRLQRLGIDEEESFYGELSHNVYFDAQKLRFFNLPEDYTKTKVYEGLFYALLQPYQEIQSQVVPGQYLGDNNEITTQVGLQIILETRRFIEQSILGRIRIGSGEFPEVSLMEGEEELVGKICRTQNFAYYLQQKHQRQQISF